MRMGAGFSFLKAAGFFRTEAAATFGEAAFGEGEAAFGEAAATFGEAAVGEGEATFGDNSGDHGPALAMVLRDLRNADGPMDNLGQRGSWPVVEVIVQLWESWPVAERHS